MDEKFESNRELLRTLLWAYLWLPILNIIVQTGYFIVMLGITENQGNMIAQIYNMTLPSTGVVVSQIFNWQLGGLFLSSLLGRYVSIVLITLPAPVIRFALLRKPIKTTSIAFLAAIVSFGLGALLHLLLFAPLLDPNAGPGNLLVQIPEYATMLFAFFATLSLLRCRTSSSKGRWIRDDESSHRMGEQMGVAPQRVAPPLRLTLDDDPFSDNNGFSKPREEVSAGAIISGSAHFGTPKDPAQQGAQGFAPTMVQQPTVLTAPDLQPAYTQVPNQQEVPPQMIPPPSPSLQPLQPAEPQTAASATVVSPAAERVAAPYPASPQTTAAEFAAQEPPVKPLASQDTLGQRAQDFSDYSPMPQEQHTMPRSGTLDRLNFPEEVVSPPVASERVEEVPLSAPMPTQTDEVKTLSGDLASLLEVTTSPEPQRAEAENTPQPLAQEPSSSGSKSLPDDLAALLKEIQVTDLPEEEPEPQLPTASVSEQASSDGKSMPDDLAALLKEIQVTDRQLGEAGDGIPSLTPEALPPRNEDESMPDDLAALLREIQVDELPDESEGDDDGTSIPTLEQLLSGVNTQPVQPAADSPPDETPEAPVPEVEVAEPKEKDAEPEKCLLCNEGTAGLECITLPNGWMIHQKCYDEALEKLSSMKTDEETKAFFESSPNLMKVLFMTNTSIPKSKLSENAVETGKTRRKTGEDKGGAPAAEKKRRAPRKTTKKTNTES